MTERPPVRLLHLGLGAFHRSHQLWHTAQADPELQWGYASFTGRSALAAKTLDAQDGLYNVLERSSDGDHADTIVHLVEPRDGSDVARFAALATDPAVAVITLTITEPGYCLDESAHLDSRNPLVVADIDELRRFTGGTALTLRTAIGRLAFALDARRLAGAGPVTVLPCDNMPDNGGAAGQAVRDMAAAYSRPLERWIAQEVRFASSVVDRITPATTEKDVGDFAARTGFRDEGLVVTEPFTEWIISGEFPAGRPDWERSGVRFVEDVAPFERRKLWLLNGAHTVLSTTARSLGHATVGDAIADPTVRGWLDEFWDCAETWLPEPELELSAYRRSLIERFSNTRIVHHLDQIAAETTMKLRFRIVPVLLSEREAGRMPDGCVRPLAGWIRSLRSGSRDQDASRAQIDEVLAADSAGERVRTAAALIALLDPSLGADENLVARISEEADRAIARPAAAH